MMNYERDYGNRNLLERAAHRVRGWMAHRGGRDFDYGDEYRGGTMNRGWDDDRGYREMGDVSGRGGYAGGMDRGYGATNWRGYNDDWNRGMGGGWGRGGGGEYRTGGYNAGHGAWDVDWDEGRPGGYGMDRGPMMDRGMERGGMGRGWAGGNERDHYMGRDFMTNEPRFGHERGWRGEVDDATLPGGDWNRGEMGGGMMGRGAMGGMNRGMMGGMPRDWDRENRDWDRGDRGDWNRGMQGGRNRGYVGGGMMDRDADLGDVGGGTIGNYGAYGGYGIERFRSASAGGVPTGEYFRGYGVGSGYRG